MFEPGPLPKTPEWFALRTYDPNRSRPVVFGASEAAAVCGVSRYEQPLSIYLRKRGEIEETAPDAAQAERMAFGLAMESVILDEYRRRRGLEFLKTGLPIYLSTEHRFMGATPDAIAVQGDAEWIVECKNSTDRMWDRSGEDEDRFGQDGTDQVPIEYMFQAQQQMAVTGLSRVDFPVLFNGNSLKIYTVRRDESIISTIIKSEAELAERIIAGNPPEVMFGHSTAAECVRSLHSRKSGKTIAMTDEMERLWNRVKKSDRLMKQIKERRDIDNLIFLDLAADADRIESPELKLKRINVSGSKFTVDRAPYSYFKPVKESR